MKPRAERRADARENERFYQKVGYTGHKPKEMPAKTFLNVRLNAPISPEDIPALEKAYFSLEGKSDAVIERYFGRYHRIGVLAKASYLFDFIKVAHKKGMDFYADPISVIEEYRARALRPLVAKILFAERASEHASELGLMPLEERLLRIGAELNGSNEGKRRFSIQGLGAMIASVDMAGDAEQRAASSSGVSMN